ncbi:BrnT family toxin [Nostoc sp. DSM 114160]
MFFLCLMVSPSFGTRRKHLLYVVYIERENDMIRIISARKATRQEREYYES